MTNLSLHCGEEGEELHQTPDATVGFGCLWHSGRVARSPTVRLVGVWPGQQVQGLMRPGDAVIPTVGKRCTRIGEMELGPAPCRGVCSSGGRQKANPVSSRHAGEGGQTFL